MSRRIVLGVALPVTLLLLAAVGCPPPKPPVRPDQVVCINSSCMAIDGANKPVEKLVLYRGKLIKWCNSSEKAVTLVFSDHKVLAGSYSLRLAPGESVVRRVGSFDTDPDDTITWEIWCTDPDTGDKTGGGGPPTEKEDPPPTTGGGDSTGTGP